MWGPLGEPSEKGRDAWNRPAHLLFKNGLGDKPMLIKLRISKRKIEWENI